MIDLFDIDLNKLPGIFLQERNLSFNSRKSCGHNIFWAGNSNTIFLGSSLTNSLITRNLMMILFLLLELLFTWPVWHRITLSKMGYKIFWSILIKPNQGGRKNLAKTDIIFAAAFFSVFFQLLHGKMAGQVDFKLSHLIFTNGFSITFCAKNPAQNGAFVDNHVDPLRLIMRINKATRPFFDVKAD